MRKAVLAGLFVLGADTDAEIKVDDGRSAIRVEEQLQAVGKGDVLDGEVGDLAVREAGQDQCKREAAEHLGILSQQSGSRVPRLPFRSVSSWR